MIISNEVQQDVAADNRNMSLLTSYTKKWHTNFIRFLKSLIVVITLYHLTIVLFLKP